MKIFLTLLVALGRMMTEKKECKSHGEGSDMLQIAIIEDEADLAQQTKVNAVRYLNEQGLEGNIAVFNDGMDIAENYKPIWDILLLDIEMPLLDGMSAAQKIREQDATVVMIFITRMAKYAIKGYEVDALDFILKPITYAQLSMKLPRAIERASQRQKNHLFVTVNGEKQRIESSAIYYIEVRGHWLYLHLHNQTLEVSGSLQEIEDRLKDQQFSRCSNSYLVNLRHVDAVKKDSIVVGANTLPLSRGRRNTFLSGLANSVTGGNMNLLQDIIKILHQPVQLLIAALMFAYKEPKRKFWLIRTVLAAILGFLVLKLCITASPEILLNSFLASLVWSISSFLILLSIEYSMFDVELKMAAYFTTLAYLTQHVAFCAWDAIQPGAGYNEPHYCSLKDIVVDTFIPFAVFALVYVVIYLLIARPMVKHGYASVSVGYSFTTMIAVLLISIVFSAVVQTSFQHQNYLYRCCRIYSMICCVLILWQQVSFQNKLAQQEELSLQKQLWMRHQAQYERASDSVKLINHKCHALKCQLSELKKIVAQTGNAPENTVLQEIENSVSVYDSIIETGNEILDTILTEKSLLCAANDITFTCVADGKAVGFLEAVDLFSMIGNALDNAEEAVRKLEDHDKRAISVSIFSRHGIAILQVENFYEGDLRFVDGLPVTTKGDPNYHGFGLKSIRSTAEKYGGTVSVQAEDGLFLLRVALPVETE